MILSVWSELDKIMGQFKDFILANKSNPLLWLGLFVLGLVVFESLFKALQKEK